MTRPRTTLPPSSAASIAASVLAGQGQYGLVSQLAREHSVTRQQVYRVGEQARAALEATFSVPAGGPPLASLELNEADIERAIVALRVVTPASIRDIEDVLPELFGIHWSYGKIQGVIVDAEARAAGWLADVDLSNIDNVALDEMFSQGKPVLGGIDLDFGYLFALDVSPTRTGAEWAEVLGGLQYDQGLTPSVVVKDAGSGLAAGVSAAWPSAEQRDDLFHAVYDMGKLARRLEGKAFGAIARVEESLDKRGKARTEKRRRSLGQLIRRRTESMDAAIARYDAFEALRREAAGVLKLTDRGSGRLRTSAEVRDALTRIAGEMAELGGDRICRLATYLSNRAAGLGSYLDAMHTRLDAIAAEAGGTSAVEAVIRGWQAKMEVQQGGPRWDRQSRQDELRAAAEHLFEQTGHDAERLQRAVGLVLPIISERHRASSPIENLNSVLRPYLVVQKSANQGFLDLFRFYWNTRKRRWGRWKGTSAIEVLTGKRQEHWLTLLGFPPSQRMHAAA